MDLSQKNDRMVGSLRGLAIGDALGAPVEFKKRGSFAPVKDFMPTHHFGLAAGQWTDDTIMALCLGDALVTADGYDSWAVMDEYMAWFEEGKNTPYGQCFDIGVQTAEALRRYGHMRPVIATDEKRGKSAGNGTLMRLAPMAIVAASAPSLAVGDRLLSISGRETHYSEEAEQATVVFGRMLMGTYGGFAKADILKATHEVHDRFELVKLLKATTTESAVEGGGYVRHSIQAAWWAFMSTDSFEDCVLAAVNLGDDADTTAAIAGQLAGAFYGDAGIPERWKAKVWQTTRLEELALKLTTVQPRVVRTRFAEDEEFQRLR